MRLLFESATMMVPLEGFTATPYGLLKLADLPSPKVGLPLPVSVVTTPRGVTSRMRLLNVSATTMTPLEGITATAVGLLKPAAAPVPSANMATPVPARVVTTPRGETSLIRWLF
jgi:hypothetical protein